MVKMIVCAVCGGSDFYENGGFSFCEECQTQTQELKENKEINLNYTTGSSRVRVKVVRKERKPKNENKEKLTSWECYNFILIGLVDELIQLGAKEKLKEVVHLLWFKYLVKYEVIRADPNALPKLGLSNWKKDAEILYGRPSKMERKKRKAAEAQSHQIEMNRKRRSAIQENYLHETTLLADGEPLQEEEPTKTIKDDLEYNSHLYDALKDKLAKQKRKRKAAEAQSHQIEMNRKRRSAIDDGDGEPLREEEEPTKTIKDDLEYDALKDKLANDTLDPTAMKSVNKNTSHFKRNFLISADILSRNRIYSILYLGLLINNDSIQLSDLIRFTREGQMSYNDIEHFLPDIIDKKNLSIQNWSRSNCPLNHGQMRQYTFEMAKSLEVLRYIPCQNLMELCERYCKELNLPDEIWRYTANLLSKVMLSGLKIDSNSSTIPNYEGRVIVMILFVLKMFFSLDGETEEEFSSYAKMVNESQGKDKKMFVWSDWIFYIKYRQLVLAQHHFPTQYLFEYDTVHNIDLFANFMTKQRSLRPKEYALNQKEQHLKYLLEVLKSKQQSVTSELEFKPTLTPFKDYLKELCKTDIPKSNNYLKKVLKKKFKSSSLDFLVDSDNYFKLIDSNSPIKVKKRGKNTKIKLAEVTKPIPSHNVLKSLVETEVKVHLIDDFVKNTRLESKPHSYKVEDVYKMSVPDTYTHYKPFENYWIRATFATTFFRKDFSNELVAGFPEPFRLVLSECARITEQDFKSLITEFVIVEIYICFIAEINGKQHSASDLNLNTLIKYVQTNW